MECKYYVRSKFFKRLFGIKGYCKLNCVEIVSYKKLQYHPYFLCECKKGNIITQCSNEFKICE
jgi:hypothetical protein